VKKTIKISIIVLGILILIAMVWLALVLFVFTGIRQYVPNPIYSQDRTKVIFPTINYNKADTSTYLCVNIEVSDAQSGIPLYKVQTHASNRMKWSIHWIGNNIFKLDSSDIGSYCWKEENGKWGDAQCP
jgi:hypothetical protein